MLTANTMTAVQPDNPEASIEVNTMNLGDITEVGLHTIDIMQKWRGRRGIMSLHSGARLVCYSVARVDGKKKLCEPQVVGNRRQ